MSYQICPFTNGNRRCQRRRLLQQGWQGEWGGQLPLGLGSSRPALSGCLLWSRAHVAVRRLCAQLAPAFRCLRVLPCIGTPETPRSAESGTSLRLWLRLGSSSGSGGSTLWSRGASRLVQTHRILQPIWAWCCWGAHRPRSRLLAWWDLGTWLYSGHRWSQGLCGFHKEARLTEGGLWWFSESWAASTCRALESGRCWWTKPWLSLQAALERRCWRV